jgi:flagellar biosynthetic protein FliQ
MNQDVVVSLTMDAISVAMKIALPMLMAGLVVGLIVSVFQAVTQIQEQTLAFIPKVVALVAIIAIFGPWMLGQLETYTTALWASIPQMVGPTQ